MDQQAASRQERETGSLDLLKRLKAEVYNGSNDEVALGIGRPVEEIEAWFDGSETMGEDAEFKIRRLADERLGGDTSGPEAATDPDKRIGQRL